MLAGWGETWTRTCLTDPPGCIGHSTPKRRTCLNVNGYSTKQWKAFNHENECCTTVHCIINFHSRPSTRFREKRHKTHTYFVCVFKGADHAAFVIQHREAILSRSPGTSPLESHSVHFDVRVGLCIWTWRYVKWNMVHRLLLSWQDLPPFGYHHVPRPYLCYQLIFSAFKMAASLIRNKLPP